MGNPSGLVTGSSPKKPPEGANQGPVKRWSCQAQAVSQVPDGP